MVVSDSVPTQEANMMMNDSGYFIHASSDPKETCVYKRTGVTRTWLAPTPAIKSNNLSCWLVEVERRAGSQTAVLSMPKVPVKLPWVA